jgi:hypothetical protein
LPFSLPCYLRIAAHSSSFVVVAVAHSKQVEKEPITVYLSFEERLVYISLFRLAGLRNFLFISSFHKVQGVTTEWSTTRKYYLAIMAS